MRIIFLTSGELGGHGLGPEETRQLRESEAAAAARILGVRQIEFWRAPDGRLRASEPLIKRLVRLLRQWRPQLVYTTHGGEMHPDHRAAPRMLRIALSSIRRRRPKVYLFEIWTPIARLDLIVDVSDWMEAKLRAVRAYESQCAVLRFDEAVAGLNRYRGEMHSWPGGAHAEVFVEMRQ